MKKLDSLQIFEKIRKAFPLIEKQKKFLNQDMYLKDFFQEFCINNTLDNSNPDFIIPPFDDTFYFGKDAKSDKKGRATCSAETRGTYYSIGCAGVAWNYSPSITKEMEVGFHVDYFDFVFNGEASGSGPASGGGYSKAFVIIEVHDTNTNQKTRKIIGNKATAAMGCFTTNDKSECQDRTIMVQLKPEHNYKIKAYLKVSAACYADYNYYGSISRGTASGKASVRFNKITIIPENIPWIQTTIRHLPPKGYDTYDCYENIIKEKFNAKSYAPMQTKIEIAAGGNYDEKHSFVNIYLDPARSYDIKKLRNDDGCQLTNRTINSSHIILQLPDLNNLSTKGTLWSLDVTFDPELDIQGYIRKRINLSFPFDLMNLLSITCNNLAKLTTTNKSSNTIPTISLLSFYDLSNWHILPITTSKKGTSSKNKMVPFTLKNIEQTTKLYISNLKPLLDFDLNDIDNFIELTTNPYSIVEFEKNLEHIENIIETILQVIDKRVGNKEFQHRTNIQINQVYLDALCQVELNKDLIEHMKIIKPQHLKEMLENMNVDANFKNIKIKVETLKIDFQKIRQLFDYCCDLKKSLVFKIPETSEFISIYDIITGPLSKDIPDMNNMGIVLVLLKRIMTFMHKHWDEENHRFEIVFEDYFVEVTGICKNGGFEAKSWDKEKYKVVFDLYPRLQPLPLIKPPC